MRLVSMIEHDGSTRCGLLLGEHVVALDEVALDVGALSIRQLLEQDRLREVAGGSPDYPRHGRPWPACTLDHRSPTPVRSSPSA